MDADIDVKKVRDLIEAQGLKSNWLAKQCGVSTAHFYEVIAGRRNPSQGLLKLLAIKLGVEEREILKPCAS